MLNFESIAELTRLTAQVSLILFCFAIIFETLPGRFKIAFRFYGAFLAVHFTHLGFVMAYFMSLGELPKLNIATAMLLLGVIGLFWLLAALVQQKDKMPLGPVWFIWALFTLGNLSRIIDPDRFKTINLVLLIIVLCAGLIRLTRRNAFLKKT